MRILVTGAAGVLGSGVARALVDRHAVRTTDLAAAGPGPDYVPAELTSYEQAREVVAGMDVVVHCAAVHPWKPYTDDQYLDSNVKAVHHVLKACVDTRVRRVVYTSSIAAVGYGPFAEGELPVREDQPPRPRDLYSLSKHMAEDVCRYFHRWDGLSVLCLRPVTFIPYEELQGALALLSARWLPPDEIVRAHALAAETELDGFHTAFLGPATPYTPADVVASQADPAAVLERYYPGVGAYFAARGLELAPIRFLFAIDRARELIGWKPLRTFDRWYAANVG
jgi:UDP-glucose 4-epimerase